MTDCLLNYLWHTKIGCLKSWETEKKNQFFHNDMKVLEKRGGRKKEKNPVYYK